MPFVKVLVRLATGHRQLITNTFTNGLLLASGDFVVQQVERHQNKKLRNHEDIPIINWKRSVKFFVTGLCFGPVLHGWYTVLDKAFPVVTAKNVAIKVLFDQIVAGPICVVYFYSATGLMEGKSYVDFLDELKRKFLATYVVDCAIYPLAQTFNFFVLPPKFRVIFVSTVTFFHSIFLSFIKNSEGKGREFIEFVDKFFSH